MEQNASQDFSGIPSPSKKDHFDIRPFLKYFTGENPDLLGHTIIAIAATIRLDFPTGLLEPPKEAFNRIAKMCGPHNGTTFEESCYWAYKNFNGPKIQNINAAWFEIARLIQIGRPKKEQPEIEWSDWREEERKREQTTPIVEFKARAPEHISNFLPKTYQLPDQYWGEKQKRPPQPLPEKKPSPVTHQPHPIQDYIFDHAPSINYLQVFIHISRHTKNRLSRRGKKIYPYTQDYVARKLKISLVTVNRIFSWLVRRGIIFKRTNENPREHWGATWFVCTSWKQSTYFRDPEGRRPKKGSPRSSRK